MTRILELMAKICNTHFVISFLFFNSEILRTLSRMCSIVYCP